MKATLKFNPALHGIRCIAAMAVLIFHWGQFFPGSMQWLAKFHYPNHPWVNLSLPLALGSEGVFLFFVLSGYLLTSQWIERPMQWSWVWQFYQRRALRIYPAFWFQLIVLVCIAYALPKTYAMLSTQNLVLTGLMWVNLPPFFVPPMNDVWWTLPVEMLFYALLPLLVLLSQKIGITWVWVGGLTLTLGWRAGVMHHYAGQSLASHLAVLDALPGVLSVFMSGVAMAFLQARIPAHWRNYMLWLAAGMFFTLQAVLIHEIEVYWNGGATLMVWSTLLSVSFALAVGGICMREAPRWLTCKAMVWLGDMSFGIYLWHFPLMLIIYTYWPEFGKSAPGSIFVLAGALAATLAMASFSYYTIERPLMKNIRITRKKHGRPDLQ